MLRSFEKFRPGTNKLVRHIDHLKKMRDGVPAAPIHLSLWPTVRCQCKCDYCCCRAEDRTAPDLGWQDFIKVIDVLSANGLKALEFAGGGEPTLWPLFSEAVFYAKNKGLKVSLITNGLELENIGGQTISGIDWIRVSIQSVEHARKIDFSRIQKMTRVSASVMFDPSINFRELHDLASKQDIVVRIAAPQPCQWEAEEALKMIERHYGAPFFFAEKTKGTPAGCYMAWIRAAMDWRGWFLPCPSVMLVDHSGRIDERFKLCGIEDLESFITERKPQDLGFRCEFCNCGKDNNDLVHAMINGVGDEDFV